MRELPSTSLPAELASVVEEYRRAKLSRSTITSYTSALRAWGKWCEAHNRSPWPPTVELVEGYLADRARSGYSVASIQLAVAALGELTRLTGDGAFRRTLRNYLEDRGTLAGIRNTLGTAPKREARPLLARELAEGLRTLSKDRAEGVRERALLLVGWSCALRRSELCALELRDVAMSDGGCRVRIRQSKTDRAGAGVLLRMACIEPAELCAACALAQWLTVRGEQPGLLFGTSTRAVARAVQRLARRLGLDSAEFSAHSLRAGLITSATLAGVPEHAVSRVSRHRSVTQLRKYIRGAEVLVGKTPAEVALTEVGKHSETK